MHKGHPRRPRLTKANGVALAACLALAALACAETTAAAPPRAAAQAAAPGAAANKLAGPPEIAWADMTKDQRLDYMKSVVAPRMKQVFTAFSPDRFSKMNCVTCHGDSAAEGSFKMPNPKLPKLPTTPDGFKKLAAERPAVMEFMKNDVKPKMAALLGVPEYNPETKAGFGCVQCHTTAQ